MRMCVLDAMPWPKPLPPTMHVSVGMNQWPHSLPVRTFVKNRYHDKRFCDLLYRRTASALQIQPLVPVGPFRPKAVAHK